MKSFEKIVNATRALVDLGDECKRQERRVNEAEAKLRRAAGGYNCILLRRDKSYYPYFIDGAEEQIHGMRPPCCYIKFPDPRAWHETYAHRVSPFAEPRCATKPPAALEFIRTDKRDELGRIIYEER